MQTNKSKEIMDFLYERVFTPVLESPMASNTLKGKISFTIMCMNNLRWESKMQYFWNAIAEDGGAGRLLEKEGFTRFEDIRFEFSERFNDEWCHRVLFNV